MELACCVKIDMAIKARNPQARLWGFTIGSGVKFFLRELRDQKTKPIQLHRRDQAAEHAVEILGSGGMHRRHQPAEEAVERLGIEYFHLRHSPQLRMSRQKDRRGKRGQETIGKIKLH